MNAIEQGVETNHFLYLQIECLKIDEEKKYRKLNGNYIQERCSYSDGIMLDTFVMLHHGQTVLVIDLKCLWIHRVQVFRMIEHRCHQMLPVKLLFCIDELLH